MNQVRLRIPLRADTPESRSSAEVRSVLSLRKGVHTVCQEAACPNLHQCFSSGTATFLILGDVCTRNCSFCNIGTGRPDLPDPLEPEKIAEAARLLSLNYIVITSVTRDDLPDGGSGHFANTVKTIRSRNPNARIEVLIPDFKGNPDSLNQIFNAAPDVINHNLETVPSLYPQVRPQADFQRSLKLLARSVRNGFITKTGIMLGFGEKMDEIIKLMSDVRNTGAQMLTIGQYLQPSPKHFPVTEYVSEQVFQDLKQKAVDLGFASVESGPRVRSSYHAGTMAGRI